MFKGYPAGFIRVIDEHTVAFPCYGGNGVFLSMGNLLASPQLGLLFIDFENPNRLRLNGTAGILENDPLLADYHEAQFPVRVTVKQMLSNCSRFIPRFARVSTSPDLLGPGRETRSPTGRRSISSATRCLARI